MKIKALQVHTSHPAIEEAGVWVPVADGVEFRVRRMRSESVSKARDRIYGPAERTMGNKKIPDKLETELTCRLLSQAVIVDWRGAGMVDDSGNPVKFTPENCEAILHDPDYGRDIRALVINAAMDGDQFVPDSEETKADEGNSLPTSNGTSGLATE